MTRALRFGKKHFGEMVDEVPIEYCKWLVTVPRRFREEHPSAYRIARRRVVAHLLAEANADIGPCWPPSLDPSLRRQAAAATAAELVPAREAVALLEALYARLTTAIDTCEDLA